MMLFLFLVFRVAVFVIEVYVLGCVASIAAGVAYRGFHTLRGRHNRDDGIPCIQCKKTAFPLAKTTTRYCCWMCGCRFDGPEHF